MKDNDISIPTRHTRPTLKLLLATGDLKKLPQLPDINPVCFFILMLERNEKQN
jgi:hypothetical protein